MEKRRESWVSQILNSRARRKTENCRLLSLSINMFVLKPSHKNWSFGKHTEKTTETKMKLRVGCSGVAGHDRNARPEKEKLI